MKQRRKNKCKHIICIAVLMVYAFLAAGSFDYAKKGIKYYNEGDYDNALKELKKSVTNGSSQDAYEYYFLGKTYEAMGDKEEAKNCYIKAYNDIFRYQAGQEERINELKKYGGESAYSELLEIGQRVYKEQSLSRNERKAFEGAETVIKNSAKNPSSIKILYKEIVSSKIVGDNDYYLVKIRASGSNSFGAIITNWYIIEVVTDFDGKLFTRNNVQIFESEPTSNHISLCKSVFGW